jgi:hypothetical protein
MYFMVYEIKGVHGLFVNGEYMVNVTTKRVGITAGSWQMLEIPDEKRFGAAEYHEYSLCVRYVPCGKTWQWRFINS